MKDIKVGVEQNTRSCRKMIEQTGDSLLLSKHSIQLSALFLLLSGSKAFFRELENIFWTCSRPRLIVFAVYGKWRNMTSICQFPGWGSHPSSFLPSIQSIDPIFFYFFRSDIFCSGQYDVICNIWLCFFFALYDVDHGVIHLRYRTNRSCLG